MILVDTSVWIDHLRRGDGAVAALLEAGQVLAHPFVIGELALGEVSDQVLRNLQLLPQVHTAADGEVLFFIQRHSLARRGIGYVDAHLLAAVHLTAGSTLLTRDKRLRAEAVRLKLAALN